MSTAKSAANGRSPRLNDLQNRALGTLYDTWASDPKAASEPNDARLRDWTRRAEIGEELSEPTVRRPTVRRVA